MEPLWEFHPGTGWVAGPLLPLPPDWRGFDTAHERHAAQVRGSTEAWADQQCLPATAAVDNSAMRPAHPAFNGGGVTAFDTAAYAPPSMPHHRPEQVPRQIHTPYDDFPLHAELYDLHSAQLPSVHQPSIAQQAGLPIAGLPAEPSAVGASERHSTALLEPEAGPSRPRDLLRATPQLDALNATGSANPSSDKRRYCRYETGTASPSSSSFTLVHASPLQQAPALLGPSLQFFDPDVPIWPRSAPARGPDDRLPEVPRRQAASLGPQGPGAAEQRETSYSELSAVDWWRPQAPADHLAVPHFDAVPLQLSLPDKAASAGSSQPSSKTQAPEQPNSSKSYFQTHIFPPFAHVSPTSLPAAQESEAFFAKSSTDEDEASVLALAALRRALQSEQLLPMATTSRAGTRSASEPASRTSSLSARSTGRSGVVRKDRRILVESGRINSTPQKRVASVEIIASCQRNGCSAALARLVLRSIPSAVVTALENGAQPNEVVTLSSNETERQAACVACLRLGGQEGVFRAGDQSYAQSGPSYEATLSAAIDRLEKIGIGASASDPKFEADGSESGSPAAESLEGTEWQDLLLTSESGLPERWKNEVLKCDVCGYVCGVGTVGCTVEHPGESPSTVEVVCARCDALFQCCSDCGGGGGRLTPGRWRSKELFPEGRKTCRLSHARNPALGEVSIDVLPVALMPADELENLERRCRAIYFNTRLAVIARPEYLIDGDGLARSYAEAERVTIDHWNLFSALLQTQPAPESNIRRYLTMMYSTPRKRHRKRSEKQRNESREAIRKVAWGFVIAQADFNDGTLCWCVTMPWPTNGQAFDAATLKGEATTKRAKADLRAISQQRVLAQPPLSPLPPLRYTYCLSPFRVGSRGNASLVRRGHEPLEELAKRDPELNLAHFPPEKSIWLPPKYAASMSVFVIRLESEADLGGPPPENAPRKRGRKVATAAEPDSTVSSPRLPPLPDPALSYSLVNLASGPYPHPPNHPRMYPYPVIPQHESPLYVYTSCPNPFHTQAFPGKPPAV